MQCEPEPDGTRNLHKLSLVDLLRMPGDAPALCTAAIERAQRAQLPTAAHVADLLLRLDQAGVRDTCDLQLHHSIFAWGLPQLTKACHHIDQN